MDPNNQQYPGVDNADATGNNQFSPPQPAASQPVQTGDYPPAPDALQQQFQQPPQAQPTLDQLRAKVDSLEQNLQAPNMNQAAPQQVAVPPQQIPQQPQVPEQPQSIPPQQMPPTGYEQIQQQAQPQNNPLPFNVPMATQGHDVMRSKIIRIIAGLLAFSVLGLLVVYLVSGQSDASLNDLAPKSNSQAAYEVPKTWKEESKTNAGVSVQAYYNGETEEVSSAVMQVADPVRMKFNGDPLTDQEAQQAFDGLIDALKSSGTYQTIENESFESDEFTHAMSFNFTLIDPETKANVSGKGYLYFDKLAHAHVVQVAAVDSYWDKNAPALTALLETYTLDK